MSLSIVVAISRNQKTGPCSATYAPIQTCPESCPLKNNGCYGQDGNCGLHFRRISKNAENADVEVIAWNEATQVRDLPGNLPLRLHVTGDCPSDNCARIISDACEAYTSKGGMPVWVYTHVWREVSRESWGSVSVAASCETVKDVIQARARGYRPALIVPLDLMADRISQLIRLGICPVLCGHFARQKQCVTCRTCLKEADNCVLLPTHGSRVRKVDEIIRRVE